MIEQRSRPFVLLLISAACIFIIIWGIRSSAYIINPILLAGIITITVLPLPEKLKKRGLPGWLSLVLTILAVVGVMAIVLLLVIVSIGKFSSALPELAAQTQARQAEESAAVVAPPPPVSGTYPAPFQLSMTIAQITDQLDGAINSQQFSELATKIIGLVANSVFLLFITMLIFAFMLSAAISLPRPSRLGLNPDSPLLDQATKYTSDVRKYMVVMTIINFLVGLGDTILLYIMGIPFALLWGVLAWVMGYIPSIGFWIALIPPVLLAWAKYGVESALIVFLFYVLINGAVQNLLQPKMMGDRLKISPVVVFVSLFVWAWLLGGIGAILAVPCTLLIVSILDSFDSTRWVVALLRVGTESEPGEKRAAIDQLKSSWERVRGLFPHSGSQSEQS